MVTAYGYVGTYATPPHPYLPPGAMGSSGESWAFMKAGHDIDQARSGLAPGPGVPN